LSDADATTATDPDTVEPPAGDVTDTDGAAVSDAPRKRSKMFAVVCWRRGSAKFCPFQLSSPSGQPIVPAAKTQAALTAR
jgi:hypothetical protein